MSLTLPSSPSSPAASMRPLATVARHPRAVRLTLYSAVVGVLLSILWSFEFVDSVIGDNVAGTLLGENAKQMAITNVGTGVLFAFISGLAGTFTACNAAAVAAFAPMGELGGRARATSSVSVTLRPMLAPVGWLTLGMSLVSGLYGSVGVILGDHLPQLSTGRSGGFPDRIMQASVVFGIIGVVFTLLGSAGLGLLPDPLRSRPRLRVFILGSLIGGFLVGRPFPLFNKLFHWAADEGNPLLGAAIFILQSLGNVALMVLVYAAIIALTRGRFISWLTTNPRRSQAIAGSTMIALGIFTVVYWVVRVPATFGYGWFPTMPYN